MDSKIDKRFPNKTSDGLRYSELQVLSSAAGYYLGRTCWDTEFGFEEPYSRESDYFATHEEAEAALVHGFEIRQCVENEAGYENGDLPKLPTKEPFET